MARGYTKSKTIRAEAPWLIFFILSYSVAVCLQLRTPRLLSWTRRPYQVKVPGMGLPKAFQDRTLIKAEDHAGILRSLCQDSSTTSNITVNVYQQVNPSTERAFSRGSRFLFGMPCRCSGRCDASPAEPRGGQAQREAGSGDGPSIEEVADDDSQGEPAALPKKRRRVARKRPAKHC